MVGCLALGLGAAEPDSPAPPPQPGRGRLLFDVLPATISGRLLVPLRSLFEWVGARVDYEQGGISAYGSGSAQPLVVLRVGSPQALLAGRPYELDVAPQILHGRTLIPLRFVAESFGVWVAADRHTVVLRLPQEDLEARMGIAPEPGSHQYKIWQVLGRWYDLRGLGPAPAEDLPHWNLFARERQAELIREAGPDAATLIEAHWRGRGVEGIRILSDAVDVEGGAAWVQVLVGYDDASLYRDDFSLVLEPRGWKVRRLNTSQLATE